MNITFKFNDNTSLKYPNFAKLNIVEDIEAAYFLIESTKKEQTRLPISKIKYVKITKDPLGFLFHKK